MSAPEPLSSADARARLRALPSVHALLERPDVEALVAASGHAAVVRAIRGALDEARAVILRGGAAHVDERAIASRLSADKRGSLRRVVNATGVIVHTNLGRAPLPSAAIDDVVDIARGYSTLEYDLDAGARGSRHEHATSLLCELTGAEDAAVVNNNAGAVLIALAALAEGRCVVVSRGELVEIGGGFRIPDILKLSGARLVEVGTTNKTRLSDYREALSDETGMLLKVHRSNFAMVGFVAEASLDELAGLAKERDLPLVYDAGSGCLLPLDADPEERSVRDALARGADLVTFSGDKLLGGPQAGLLVGRRDVVQRVRKHPLMRALRPDKLCLAALLATLRLWRDRPEAIPIVGMMRQTETSLEQRAAAIVEAVGAERRERLRVVATKARIGGGASPLVELDSRAIAVGGGDAEAVAGALRDLETPVIARIVDGAVLLDVRTLLPEEDGLVARALDAVLDGAHGTDGPGHG